MLWFKMSIVIGASIGFTFFACVWLYHMFKPLEEGQKH